MDEMTVLLTLPRLGVDDGLLLLDKLAGLTVDQIAWKYRLSVSEVKTRCRVAEIKADDLATLAG